MAIRLAILGAGGTGRDVRSFIDDINAVESRYECLGFLDDNEALWGTHIQGSEVLGSTGLARQLLAQDVFFVDALGSPRSFWRKEAIWAGLGIPDERFATLIHPTAHLAGTSRIGHGVVLYPYVVVMTGAVLGSHVVVLSHAVINHDVSLGDYTIVASGAALSGGVHVERCCYVGSRSVIREHVRIGERCLIGMGSVVLKDVPANQVVVGNPARFLRPVVPSDIAEERRTPTCGDQNAAIGERDETSTEHCHPGL